jgi:hypothetical protein
VEEYARAVALMLMKHGPESDEDDTDELQQLALF